MDPAAQFAGTAVRPDDVGGSDVLEYPSSLPNLADTPLQDWRAIVTSPVLLNWIENPELTTAAGFHSSV